MNMKIKNISSYEIQNNKGYTLEITEKEALELRDELNRLLVDVDQTKYDN